MEIVDQRRAPPPLKKDAFWDMEEAKLKHLDDLDRAASQFDPNSVNLSKMERNDPGKMSNQNISKTSRSSSYQRLNPDDPEA